MFNFANAATRYEPYPLSIIRPVMDEAFYAELCENFPDVSKFAKLPKYDYKLSLSERFNPEVYREFIRTNRPWNRFHSWVKSDDFIKKMADFLKTQHIDLGLDEYFEPFGARLRANLKRIFKGQLPRLRQRLYSRFEFSVLKADGGEVEPHTDMPRKIITLVFTMIKPGEWPEGFGGGLDINRATDNADKFNFVNHQVAWDKIEVVDTVDFVPNQCAVFVKTFNSLHSVRRMTQAGSTALRKTVTIVIEKPD